MDLTLRQLNRATLGRQMLLEREKLDVVSATRRIAAIQAQEPASPFLALWNRVAGFVPEDLATAFATQQIVKAPLMRITLHAVVADEYTAFHEAMLENLRASRLNDRRFSETGLSIADADELVPHLIEFAAAVRTKEEIESLLEERLGGPPHRYVWWALRTFAPLIHAPSGESWSFGQRPVYRAAPVTPPRQNAIESTAQLITKYLEAFGPATAQDMAQFAMLRQSQIRPALDSLSGALVAYRDPAGKALYDIPGREIPPEESVAPPHLLGMWDSCLLAYANRSRIIPEEYRKIVIRNNGDVLPTLLVDGFVAGVWRHGPGGIEARSFSSLPAAVWDHLDIEAASLFDMLDGRDDNVYGRYGRWWDRLPDGESRILGR